MGRKLMRVPLDFNWPTEKVWDGFLLPDNLQEEQCPDCKNGYSPYYEHLHDQWYGNAPFNPEDTGSTPLTPLTPAVFAFAERNVNNSPEYYGFGTEAKIREATRLARMWNKQWSHHLSQEDVDVLVAENRLHELTSRFVPGKGWEKLDPPVHPTAAEVNTWSLGGFGHDSINAWAVIRARCKRDNQPHLCATCDGNATQEIYEGQRAEAEAWESYNPPTGEGWQMWETVSEGSPVSPVFATADELVIWMTTPDPNITWMGHPYSRKAAEAFVKSGTSIGSFAMVGGEIIDGVEALVRND